MIFSQQFTQKHPHWRAINSISANEKLKSVHNVKWFEEVFWSLIKLWIHESMKVQREKPIEKTHPSRIAAHCGSFIIISRLHPPTFIVLLCLLVWNSTGVSGREWGSNINPPVYIKCAAALISDREDSQTSSYVGAQSAKLCKIFQLVLTSAIPAIFPTKSISKTIGEGRCRRDSTIYHAVLTHAASTETESKAWGHTTHGMKNAVHEWFTG